MSQHEGKTRQTIDLTEFVTVIDRYAKQERRNRAQMIRVLLAEAIESRRQEENKTIG